MTEDEFNGIKQAVHRLEGAALANFAILTTLLLTLRANNALPTEAMLSVCESALQILEDNPQPTSESVKQGRLLLDELQAHLLAAVVSAPLPPPPPQGTV